MNLNHYALTLLLVLSGQSSIAQLSLGMKAGMNHSSVNDKSPSIESGYMGTANGWGGCFGLFGRIPLGERLFVEPELVMSVRRTEIKHAYIETFSFGGSQRIEITNAMQFNYLELPVLLVLKVHKGFHVQAGPQYAHLLGGRWKEVWAASGSNSFGEPYVDRESTEEEGSKVIGRRSHSEFGLVLGGGYRWSNGLGLALRYLKSFSYIETGESDYLYGRYSVLTFSMDYALIRPRVDQSR